MNYRSFSHLAENMRTWSTTLPRDIDLVVGVPRSGLLVANLIALYRDLPLADLDGLLEGNILATGPRCSRPLDENSLNDRSRTILVVDDCVASGGAMREVMRKVEPLRERHEVLLGAAYYDPRAEVALDVAYEPLHMPYIFEWNLMHSWIVENGCLDMDGVLCHDPEPHEDDDGPLYERFLRETKPHMLPTRKIARIVTSRLEKYRALTESWLQRHGVRYEELTMMDCPSAAERDATRCHGTYKAEVYRSNRRYQLFVESEAEQARHIARLSGKPVFCIETMEMLNPGLYPWQNEQTAPSDYHRNGTLVGRLRRGMRRASGLVRAYAREARSRVMTRNRTGQEHQLRGT
jgi:orotate phosphoribosyltransferase